jgi:hypothetical protein
MQFFGRNVVVTKMVASSVQPNLSYLSYQEKYPINQLYLIAPFAAEPQAISSKGDVTSISSSLQLPVLCTQTAPFSNFTFRDTSEKLKVIVPTNNEPVTGQVPRCPSHSLFLTKIQFSYPSLIRLPRSAVCRPA